MIIAILTRGINTYEGKVTHEGVSSTLGLPLTPLKEAIGR